jgi:2-oxoglutarate dehydrogenase E1 component
MPDQFTFADGNNIDYLEKLYQSYLKDPRSVDLSWQGFFAGYEFAAESAARLRERQSAAEGEIPVAAKIEAMINSFRRLGHLCAQLNPLEKNTRTLNETIPELNEIHAINSEQKFVTANFSASALTFAEIVQNLTLTYCGSIGADFRENNDDKVVRWWQEQMESCQNKPQVSPEKKRRIFDKLVESDGFEKFLQARYLGQKRFSIEGLDAVIPLLDQVISELTSLDYEELCIGMAHRGRLNILVNILGKPYAAMLKEFEGSEVKSFDIDGDVKYHMGFCGEVKAANLKSLRVYLASNPSHLEAVNPVVEGFTNSRQRLLGGEARKKIIPMLFHGDAAFAGQGIVAETLNLSQLDAYKTGGTIHVITNNQIGFTTNPRQGRSCLYSSDISKFLRAPVLHVNADDPEAVVWAAQLAVKFRHQFQQDVVIDVIGYRRHGHNETDEPSFTQPLMYKAISSHQTLVEIYQQKLIAEKVLTADEAREKIKTYRAALQAAYDLVHKNKTPLPQQPIHPAFREVYSTQRVSREEAMAPVDTTVTKQTLQRLSEVICTVPKGFEVNPKLARIIQGRQQMLSGEGAIDWGYAELLAFASLADQGFSVRLSGQDCQRGTFSSRQGVYVELNSNRLYEPLQQIGSGSIELINSPLSELGCMGFEFGYSIADPKSLVLWEAQFGDFSNGAQIIIDQFLTASEAKWQQTSGLVLLLPHGYEGMGPEHSSARPERFLQCCGNLNVQVVNVTSAAQLFHLLRRQMLRNYRKPLVVMTPKSLLRHPKVVSTLKEFTEQRFQEIVIDQGSAEPKAVEKLILCTGKVSIELAEERAARDLSQVPILRVEQLYPFPREAIGAYVATLPKLKSILWVQEEPQNMGGWSFVFPRLHKLLNKKIEIIYVGRRHSGSTAEGSGYAHKTEQQRIIEEALGLISKVKIVAV